MKSLIFDFLNFLFRFLLFSLFKPLLWTIPPFSDVDQSVFNQMSSCLPFENPKITSFMLKRKFWKKNFIKKNTSCYILLLFKKNHLRGHPVNSEVKKNLIHFSLLLEATRGGGLGWNIFPPTIGYWPCQYESMKICV